MAEIQVTSGTDRETPEQQISRILEAMRQEVDGEIRLRLPLNIFDPDQNRSYTQIRDTFWNMRLPAATASVEQVHAIIAALDLCVEAIGTHGPQAVIDRLRAEEGRE